MKLTNNRLYLDYNATSPLAPSVSEWIAKGDLLYGNPSSIHSSGKKSKRFINQTSDYLFETFGVDKNSFKLFFHSGATEGNNSLIRGHAKEIYKSGKRLHFFYAATDHSSINNLREELELYGHHVHMFPINENGDFDFDQLVESMKKLKGEPILLNYTWVNNESGVCWSLESALKIKEATGCQVHVDGVQAIGKIPNWQKLLKLDAYTFSGHKFGGLKGAGFSFIHEDYIFSPFIRGGGQQQGLRSGTENTVGIYSLKLALEDLQKKYDYSSMEEGKNSIEKSLKELIGDKGIIVGEKAACRNGNTIYFILNDHRADVVMTAFDLAGMDVSSGSACSSGAVRPSRVLLNMGYTEEQAKSAIRISFDHFLNIENSSEVFEKIQRVLGRFIS